MGRNSPQLHVRATQQKNTFCMIPFPENTETGGNICCWKSRGHAETSGLSVTFGMFFLSVLVTMVYTIHGSPTSCTRMKVYSLYMLNFNKKGFQLRIIIGSSS